MHRCYLPAADFSSSTLTLEGEEAHHALRVMRLRAGDECEVFDGAGKAARARILAVVGGSLTLGEPYKTMVVEEEVEEESVENEEMEMKMPSIKACVQSNYNFSFNGLKMDEVKGQAILRAFKSFVENPEFLME